MQVKIQVQMYDTQSGATYLRRSDTSSTNTKSKQKNTKPEQQQQQQQH